MKLPNNILKKNPLSVKPLNQNKNEDSKQNSIQNQSKKDILKVLIYIYYYEKNNLNIKNGISFNAKGKYYLINPIWIKELKNYYDYQNISKILDEFDKGSNIQISLGNLENNNILYRIKKYLNNCNINLLNKPPNVNLKDSKIKKLPIKNAKNFIYYSNGYIINSKILEIIENYFFEGQKIKINSLTILSKENNIFVPYIYKNTAFLALGNLDNELIFNASSCLYYYNLETFKIEKNKLIDKSFKDYIISRECKENNLYIQNLINEDNIIGLFLKLSPPNNRLLEPTKKNFSSNKVTGKFIEENKGNCINKNPSIEKKIFTRNNSYERCQSSIIVNLYAFNLIIIFK